MKILLSCVEMVSLTGSPMYHLTLALELKRLGHDVCFFSSFADNIIQEKLKEAGVNIVSASGGRYDLALISQPSSYSLMNMNQIGKVFNIIHSEYDCEAPITSDRVDAYIAIRPSIAEHIITEHDVPISKVHVIYNGIDLDRFNPVSRFEPSKDFVKVVLPCTIDDLRIDFINWYTRQAREKFRVYIYGHDYGRTIHKNEYVFVYPPTFQVEKAIADADFVAGILLGRVNLEARAMGIPSMIHDPKNPGKFQYYYPERQEFDARHDIKNVAQQIIKLYDDKL